MASPLDDATIKPLKAKAVWDLFRGMCAVPRASKKEQRIRAHVRAVARAFGFESREDGVGNIVIDVPAKKGCEKAAVTVLQGHLDMVCEKNSDTVHDFDNDPIRPMLDKDENGRAFVRADGTTLGADNGIGVCMAMAAAASPDVVHGRLEILCTIDEEMGMTGAKALKPDFFKGKRMLNLDSEEDDAVYIGCAGGCDTNIAWRFKTAAPSGSAEACRVAVAGLKGGHSGCDIHLNRANAIKLLAQTLSAVPGVQLAAINGGSKRNVIPREASAVVIGPAGTIEALNKAGQLVQADAVRENKEETCSILAAKASAADARAVLSADDTKQVLTTITALPHGVLAVVPEIPGLIQTSNSTSIVQSQAEDGAMKVVIMCLSRSSSAVAITQTVQQLAAIGRLAGASVDWGNDYPGWAPDPKSALLATCRRLYERQFGAAPRVMAIHAGLECGIIGERMGGMDMVSFGPTITGAHSPDERVYVDSVEKSYGFLKAVLAELAAS